MDQLQRHSDPRIHVPRPVSCTPLQANCWSPDRSDALKIGESSEEGLTDLRIRRSNRRILFADVQRTILAEVVEVNGEVLITCRITQWCAARHPGWEASSLLAITTSSFAIFRAVVLNESAR